MKKVSLLLIVPLAFSFMACATKTGETTRAEMEQTEVNHAKLVEAVPPPRLETSQERVNLKKRLERFNNENKISYIYLLSYGRVMAYYTVRGKVSSVNSLLTCPDQLMRSYKGGEMFKMPSPDLDGSYGSNGDAIFFFTTNDVYVEWCGDYMLSDEPLRLSEEPLLVRTVN